VPEVRGEEERDSAFSFQRGEWFEQRRLGQVIRRVLGRRKRVLWGRLRLPLSFHVYQ